MDIRLKKANNREVNQMVAGHMALHMKLCHLVINSLLPVQRLKQKLYIQIVLLLMIREIS